MSKAISGVLRGQIYPVYKTVFAASDFSLQKKNAILTSLLGAEDWSWRVVGVSVEAFALLSLHEFTVSKDVKLQRSHIESRISLARRVFVEDVHGAPLDRPLDQDEFFDTVWALDRTILTLRAENKAVLHSDLRVIGLPARDADDNVLFRCGNVGYRFGKIESKFLANLAASGSNLSASAIQWQLFVAALPPDR